MRNVRFHFLAAGCLAGGSSEELDLAALILANSLSRQGYDCSVQANSVVVSNPPEHSPDQVFLLLDEVLLRTPDLLSQVSGDSAVVVGSARPAHFLRQQMGRTVSDVAAVDVSGIATEAGADPLVALLGGAARCIPLIDREALCASVWHTYDRGLPYAARSALRALDLGYSQTQLAAN